MVMMNPPKGQKKQGERGVACGMAQRLLNAPTATSTCNDQVGIALPGVFGMRLPEEDLVRRVSHNLAMTFY
jgi:hypothetical protein